MNLKPYSDPITVFMLVKKYFLSNVGQFTWKIIVNFIHEIRIRRDLLCVAGRRVIQPTVRTLQFFHEIQFKIDLVFRCGDVDL